jgi:PAS domain S-box-containing protein
MLLISYRLLSKALWREQEPSALQSAVFQSASLAAALIALGTDQIMQSSRRFCELAGYQATDLHNQTATQLHLWTATERQMLLQSLHQQGVISGHLCQMRHQSGHLIEVELSLELMQLNRQPHLLVIATESGQQTAAKLQSALEEKAMLLREVHHRVRNNLHLINSLLDLQASTLNDDCLSALFATAQNRIQSMTLIYEQLYESADLGQINLGEYLKRLTLNAFLTNSKTPSLIQPQIAAEPLCLNLETAVPCGLLINELVVNSLKHAFPNGKAGEVQVKLAQIDQQVQITVCDSGVGLAPDFEWQAASSLGFRLIRILAKQLKANIHLESNASGTTVEIRFAELPYQPRF